MIKVVFYITILFIIYAKNNVMKKLVFIFYLLVAFVVFAQQETFSIEYEKHRIGVFNPEKTIYHSLNPTKSEHITGYFREQLAKTIFDAIKEKKIKIFDERKREISVESVEKRIVDFEKNNFNITLSKEQALEYAIKFIGAYDFEEAIKYDYKDLCIEKKVLSYCPYMVRYKSFDENIDTLMLPLFWIFVSKNELALKNNANNDSLFTIPDTIYSTLPLKYPIKMPFTLALFNNVKEKKTNVFQSNGKEFKTMKEIDDLFVLSKSIGIYDEQSGKDVFQTIYSDIEPEDIEAVKIAENWSINPYTLEIGKKIQFYLPLYKYDEGIYRQIGFRIYNKRK